MAVNAWAIATANFEVSFKVKKLGLLTIKGAMADFSGDVSFSKAGLAAASFNVWVSPATIDTGSGKRDEHLKSEDFFDVNTYPNICFNSTSVQSATNGFKVAGKLSMLGVTKEATIYFFRRDL